jgi:tripartite-type tricarboxylate transporter receptor subunit TctC
MSRIARTLVTAAVVALASPAFGSEPVSFEGKAIKLIIPSTPGGGTDTAARLIGRFLSAHLPGTPSILPQNMPGGGGVTSLNFLSQQAKPDGLTIVVSSSTEADPLTYRTEQAKYNPAKLGIIGGFGLGEQLLVIRKEALPRLLDKSQPPVAMGNNAGQPRRGMRMNLWGSLFLGWNTKWVNGYPGSNDLLLALQRGEIDMTAFGSEFLRDKVLDPAKFTILYSDGISKSSGPSGRADFDAAPKFVSAMEGKIADPKIRAAYDYWRASFFFKWVALSATTPKPIVDAYRAAFVKLKEDEAFNKMAENLMPGFALIPGLEMAQAIADLDATTDDALKTTDELLRDSR